jgi:tetratricopeptide (TPR) repeat protein
MRHSLVLLCLAVACFPSRPSLSQSCEPTASTLTVLEQLQVPGDAHLPAAQRRELKLQLLRRALAAAPSEIALHEAYQNVRLGGMEINRPDLIAEYEQLLAKHLNDPIFLYLAAEARMGRKTEEAIANLHRAIELSPSFGLPHLLLAQIYFSHAYENTTEGNRQLGRFAESCPVSVRALGTVKWSKDKELIAREAARLRHNIEARTDSEAVAAYPTLWSFEGALERSDQQSENLVRLRHDLDRLFTPAFVRNSAWLATIQVTDFFDGAPEGLGRKAQHEVAALYPNSDAALGEEYANLTTGFPFPRNGSSDQITAYWRQKWHAILPLARKWPATEWVFADTAIAVAEDHSATPQEVGEVIALFESAIRQDPDGGHTSPPQSISVAQALIERGGPFDTIPELAMAGFTATARQLGPDTVNDVNGPTEGSLSFLRNVWYLMGYVPLAEAYVRLGRLGDASEALSQAALKLQALHPGENASSNDKARYADLAAPFWFVRGLYAEKDGRKIDALVDYRNALTLYPPRRPGPDRRDEVMASAERVWKELGGTSQGWNDWAAASSLAGFYGGAGGSQAWSKLAESSPDLVFTDALGNHWNPRELAKKTTFVSMWASWCGPCRAELPYLEKLYLHFRDRNDVAILAFNVDDNPKAMTTALQELRVSIPSIAARDFAYSIVPEMALPANWIITPGKTEMLAEDNSSHEAWLQSAVTAIEKAAAGK